MKKGGSPMDCITTILKENGYGIETLFLRAMEKLGLIKSGKAEEELMVFPVDPCFGTKSLIEGKKEDNDEQMFKNFQPKLGVAVGVIGFKGKLFRPKEHKETY